MIIQFLFFTSFEHLSNHSYKNDAIYTQAKSNQFIHQFIATYELHILMVSDKFEYWNSKKYCYS